MTNAASNFPLEWPAGWERTPDHKRKTSAPFRTTFDRAKRDLQDELRRLGARDLVISSWLAVKNDGTPYSDQARRRIPDPGVAVYFTLRGRQMVMARDAYATPHDNLRSIGLGIAHMRGLERHGGATMMERAFEGFTTLGNPDNPLTILGLKPGASQDEIKARYRDLARSLHPDAGGDPAHFAKVTAARDNALSQAGGF